MCGGGGGGGIVIMKLFVVDIKHGMFDTPL